jgi:uncharacterized membrane protein (UPF0127 family)
MKTTKIKELEKVRNSLLNSKAMLLNITNSNIDAVIWHINTSIDMIEFEIVYIQKSKP